MSSWMTRYSLGIGNFMNADREHQCDVLVIGSGAAGLSLALQVAQYGKVIVLSKGP
ncbi:FAD-binding protein, partial [Vibrio cholerae]